MLDDLRGNVRRTAAVLLAESMDHTLRTPVEVEHHLGKQVLAVLPKMSTARTAARRIGSSANRTISS